MQTRNILSVVTWRWGHKYSAESVNTLFRMVRRWYGPHRSICVTNDRIGIDPEVEIVADRADFATVPNPSGAQFPSCYRRLRLWDGAEFGERVVSLDLDAVVVGDMRPLWDRDDDIVAWQDPLYPQQLNGSMVLLKAGARPDVWSDFAPHTSPLIAKAAGYRGSDQAWLSFALPDAGRWTAGDGVHSFRHARELPEGARIVFFHGGTKPWDVGAQRVGWVREHYQ